MFAFYSNIVHSGSNSDQANIWRKAITEVLVSIVVHFIAATREGVFMSRTSDPRIPGEGFGVLFPLSKGSVRWKEDLGFSAITKETCFDPALPYFASCRILEVDWSQADLLDLNYLYRWRTDEIAGLCKKRVYARKCEYGNRFVYNERRLRAVRVMIRLGVRPFSIEDCLAATQAAFESDCLLELASALHVTTP